MLTKTEYKVVLLFCPQQLLQNSGIVQALHIKKSEKGISYDHRQLEHRELNQSFNELPKSAKETLVNFDPTHSLLREKNIESKYRKGKAGVPYKEFYPTALLRDLHALFETLKPFTPLVKWYTKYWVDKHNAKTTPCTFSGYKPHLTFEVIQDNVGLHLKTWISLNNDRYPLEDFDQHNFFLFSNGEYFLLSFKDYQTLQWIKQADASQYRSDPQEMAKQVLARLEADYEVNRNELFTQHLVEMLPVNRVLLSEISGSFLVLTPQWLYEGFLTEGPFKETYETTVAGEAYLIRRDREAENNFTKLLVGLHPNFPRQLNGYYYLPFADAQKKQWFLKCYHFLLEQNIQVVGMDMLKHFRYSTHKAETSVDIHEGENNSLTVKLSLKFGTEEVPLNELQKMLLAGQRAILLKDGSLGILGDEWIAQYAPLIKHGKVGKKELTVAKWMALTEDNNASDSQVLKTSIKQDWWLQWQDWQQPGKTIFQVPAQVRANLRPYQQKGFEWMVMLSQAGAGACLADDMGLGKTLQTICFLAWRYQHTPNAKFLIICPSSLLYNWEQEIQKFAPHLEAHIYHGAQRNFEELATKPHQVMLTTYGTLRSDIEKLATIAFDVAVIDESHNIKNPAALITKAVGLVNATTRIALSGTPVMNNTFDLYAQLNFLLPGMFGSREFFKREYADAIDRDQDPEKIKALQKLTAPFILRRTKEQVAPDLPEKMETILWCNMGADQKQAYESIKENVRSSIFIDIKEKGLGSGKLSVINGLLKLRQVCNSASLVKDEDLFTDESIKTEILVEELKNIIPGHKALVFSQFTSMLDLLEISLTKNNISWCRLDGATPIQKRQELVNNFQQEGTESVFLISLKAGNAGLNLTAADYVFLFDPWWNTAVQQQAIDRTHRIGQTKNVFAYKMICKGTIEEKIMVLQQRKKKLAEELIGEEEGFVKSLTENDIEFLFS
ncbi:MAG: DEAD/DEAH box helicase [Bacteroidota bacterium]